MKRVNSADTKQRKLSKDGQRMLYCKDYQSARTDHSELVPLIIADPPYNLGLADWDQDFDFDPLMDVIANKLTRTGSALIFNTYTNSVHIHNLAVAHGLKVYQLLVWVKPNFPFQYLRTKGYVTKNREYILWVGKTKKPFFQLKSDEKYHTGVFTYSRAPSSDTRFPFEKPKALIDDLILRHSRPYECVLDLFAGSGVVARSCKQWGRHYVGYEFDPTTFDQIDLDS
ncbi:MAG: adenine-specific methyltransferase [Bacillus sp. (in: firmicutes)]|jgi:DNA (cytosine-5)-methyltransferase 1/site-specific DNA-methyltransferase (adenine-specific)|nr:adenine-specific methyltransferase [Bacillus sp. (in: firmicutes)]